MTKKGTEVFLTARWENLIHITFKVNKNKLFPFLPQSIELDLYEGDAIVSLVAFHFKDMSIKGIPVPLYGNFPEVNLRFNVRDKSKKYRGVVFIKELIPRAAIALAANTLYKEHYISFPMKSEIKEAGGIIRLNHTLHLNKKDFFIEVIVKSQTMTPQENSIEHFVKQRNAGFGKTKNSKTLVYQVEHSLWEIYTLISFKFNLQFGEIFGSYWEFLGNEQPLNVMLAKGSPVKVYEWKYYDQQ